MPYLEEETNDLVKYLARSKHPEFVDTVVSLTRKIARSEEVMVEKDHEISKMRDRIDPEHWNNGYNRRIEGPGGQQIMELPHGTRKVSIEL